MAAERNPYAPEGAGALTLNDLRGTTPMEVIVHFQVGGSNGQPMMFLEMHEDPPKSPWVEARYPNGRTRNIFLADIGVCATEESGNWAESYVVRAPQ